MNEQDNKPVVWDIRFDKDTRYRIVRRKDVADEIAEKLCASDYENVHVVGLFEHPPVTAAPTPPAAQAYAGARSGGKNYFNIDGSLTELGEKIKASAQAGEEMGEVGIVEVLHQRFTNLPRYSFHPVALGIRKVPDSFGNWVEWSDVSALLDATSFGVTQPAAVRSGASSEPLGAGRTETVGELIKHLDGAMVPTESELGIKFSLWGRVLKFARLSAEAYHEANSQSIATAPEVRREALEEAEEAVRTLYEADEPPYLVDIARAIRALSSIPINANEFASSALNASQVPASEQGAVVDHSAGYEKLREFIKDFEIDTGEGIYYPNENERFVIEQFVLELMNNDDSAEFIDVRYTTKKPAALQSQTAQEGGDAHCYACAGHGASLDGRRDCSACNGSGEKGPQ